MSAILSYLQNEAFSVTNGTHPYVAAGGQKITDFSTININAGARWNSVNSRVTFNGPELWMFGVYWVAGVWPSLSAGVLHLRKNGALTSPGALTLFDSASGAEVSPAVVNGVAGDYFEIWTNTAANVDQLTFWGARIA